MTKMLSRRCISWKDAQTLLVLRPMLALTLFFSPTGVAGQKVRVEEELEAYPTESVDLRCMFVDGVGTKLTQVRQGGSAACCVFHQETLMLLT